MTIGDIANKIYSGGTPNTREASFWGGNLKWLSSGETGNCFIYDTEKKITESGVKNSSTRLAHSGSIVVACAGQGYTRGQASMLMTDTYINQSVICIEPNTNLVDPFFLYYYLKNSYSLLRALSDGHSSRGSITTVMLKELVVDLPSLEYQKKAAKILYDLDKKCELNSRQNLLLEKQASAIIKNYSDQETSLTTLKTVLSFDNGYTFKSKNYVTSGPFRVITIKNVKDGIVDSSSAQCIDNLPSDIREHQKLCIGDVLVSLTGNVGRTGIVFEDHLLLNQRVAKIKPKNSDLLPFFYFLFRQVDFKRKLESLAKGTAQQNLSPVEALNLSIKYSEQSSIAISKLLTPMFRKVISNNRCNAILLEMRDTFLPKLMLGEINLDKVEI